MGFGGGGRESAGALPYGDERRVGIARALAIAPRYLLLDEPAAGMSDAECDALVLLIERIPTAFGCGVLLIEHNMRVIMNACVRIHVIDSGCSATRQGWSRGNGVCDDFMKPCLSSSGCETRPAKGEPARPVASLAPETVTDSAKRRHASEWAVGR